MGQEYGPAYQGLENGATDADQYLYPAPAGFAGLPCRFDRLAEWRSEGEKPQYASSDVLSATNAQGDLLVKNTFLNYGNMRPPSLEGFFQERETRSAPGSGLMPCSEEYEQDGTPTHSEQEAMLHAEEAQLEEPMPAWVNPHALPFPDPSKQCGAGWGAAAPRGVTFEFDDLSDVPVLRLADRLDGIDDLALPPDVDLSLVGTVEMPTVGSAGHALGICKPCAFLDKGCANGKDCDFCHLCPPDEKNRRKKEKLAMRRQMCRWQKEGAKTSWKGQAPVASYTLAAMSYAF